jgi:hypothetical protein
MFKKLHLEKMWELFKSNHIGNDVQPVIASFDKVGKKRNLAKNCLHTLLVKPQRALVSTILVVHYQNDKITFT